MKDKLLVVVHALRAGFRPPLPIQLFRKINTDVTSSDATSISPVYVLQAMCAQYVGHPYQ
jgi:hypothetical protein